MSPSPSPKSASVATREVRQTKGRNRHLPHQTDALNEVFERTEHPSLQERTDLAKRLGMETKVVNSWFQNKRASIRKKAQRVEPELDELPSNTKVAQPQVPLPSTVVPVLVPPRSFHPSLPRIADILHGTPAGAVTSSESDPEDDNMSVHLPPIKEDHFTRPAFLSPSLAAVCIPKPLPPKVAAPLPYQTSPPAFTRSLLARSGSPHSNRSGSRSEHLGISHHQSAASRSVSDSFSEKHSRRSRGHDTLSLSHRHQPYPLQAKVQNARSQSYPAQNSEYSYSREASQEIDELIDESPAASTGSRSYVARRRPDPEQLTELRAVFARNTHPSREEREALSEVTGMRLQTISNWFQHQRSMVKRRQSEGSFESPLPIIETISIPPQALSPPASESASALARTKRSRPEAHQLESLKALYDETTTPTMEQRSSLALELGMAESKVTNWFRNARQTAKKRARVAQSAPEDSDMDAERHEIASTPTNRSAIPVLSITPSHNEQSPEAPRQRSSEHMDVDDYDDSAHTGSDYDGPITPSPSSLTQPLYGAAHKLTGANVDDAALLLSLRAGDAL